MLEQVAQEAIKQGPSLTPVYVILAPLALKAVADIGRELVKGRNDRARARETRAEADLEQAKAYGLSIVKSKNGVPDKQTLVAFCPAHIDMVKEQTKQGVELDHINTELKEIKDDVKYIRGAVGK